MVRVCLLLLLSLGHGGCCLLVDEVDVETSEDPFIRQHDQRSDRAEEVDRRLRRSKQERATDPDPR